MRMFLKRLAILVLILPLLTGISGCASLFNPHYSPLRVTPKGQTATMEEAVTYADNAIDAYRKGVGDQANLSAWTGTALIPLSAVVVGLGTLGGHSNSVTNLALGGAAAYGMSSWLSSPVRSLVYVDGIGALNCAKESMRPWYVSNDWMADFNTAMDNLSTKIPALTHGLSELEALISVLEGMGLAGDPQVKAAKALAKSVTGQLAGVRVTQENGFTLKHRLETAGQALIFAVDRINGEMDKALLSTVPNLTALPSVIASLNPAADMFRQGSAPAEVQTVKAADKANEFHAQSLTRGEATKIKSARNDLNAKVREVKLMATTLAGYEGFVRSAVKKFEQPVSDTLLKQCGVSEEDIVKPLKVLPDTKVTVAAGSSTSIFLFGGSGQYGATLTGEIKGVTVSQPVPLGEVVRIEAGEDTPSAQTHILIKDIAGRSVFVELTITGKGGEEDMGSKNGNGQTGTMDTGNKTDLFKQSLGKDTIRQIQTALRICNDPSQLVIDGIIGFNTRNAALICEVTKSSTPDAAGIKVLTDKFIKDGLPKPGPVTKFEKGLLKGDMKEAYTQIGMEITLDTEDLGPWFTEEFRRILQAYQKTSDAGQLKEKQIGISGLLTQEFPWE